MQSGDFDLDDAYVGDASTTSNGAGAKEPTTACLGGGGGARLAQAPARWSSFSVRQQLRAAVRVRVVPAAGAGARRMRAQRATVAAVAGRATTRMLLA
jgi:hypothetical protein